LRGDGLGAFGTAQVFAVGMKPEFVVAGDVNGDGILDLAVANVNSGTVTVLLGNGDGTFQPGTRTTLSVVLAGTGHGTVTSSETPPKINCGATCSASYATGTVVTLTAQAAAASYDSGTVVTLTAAPATGSAFAGWSGCDTVSGTTCTVTMSASRSVTATFNLQSFTLTVSKAGLGRGTVTSTSSPGSPTQIDCGTTCSGASAPFNYGTVVTLTATPGTLSLFTGWS